MNNPASEEMMEDVRNAQDELRSLPASAGKLVRPQKLSP